MTPHELSELVAKERIRARITAYCRGVDRCDADLIRATYHDDAVEDHGDKYRGGPDGFVEWVIGHVSAMSGSMHALHQIDIDLAGDVAYVESYATARHVLPDADGSGEVLETLGVRYLDRFEHRPEAGWRVARRVVALDYYDVHALPPRARWRTGFATPHQSQEDPSYVRG
ncbi:nuclear transport factor 2 family protein [Aeromicrobium choanae]|uniref:SnoaL-like domain-containing protein n=1 Tax=Aeromicrobium choanae TaxID=1736691 RepID=A0A1T4Z5W9_9ACTN|nr:nuclear transport factor 2 family protein [Aeromicrobium choanae]SKB09440.1 SnoaL-like domain-containing protein [Aeromicrobium choanae]